MFTRKDGTARKAGLPVIKFHAARHTAATLALEGKIETKIVSRRSATQRRGSPRTCTSMSACSSRSARLR
jgi:integrase